MISIIMLILIKRFEIMINLGCDGRRYIHNSYCKMYYTFRMNKSHETYTLLISSLYRYFLFTRLTYDSVICVFRSKNIVHITFN